MVWKYFKVLLALISGFWFLCVGIFHIFVAVYKWIISPFTNFNIGQTKPLKEW
jgi:hypothetical protein